MRLGLAGFIVSMLICGGALALGLAGLMGPTLVFAIFMLGRSFYGAFGSASPSAVQAYVAARTDGEARTSALALLASSFGLGTIIGPAIAPLFIFPPLGLSGAADRLRRDRRASCSPASSLRLPDDTPKNRGARARSWPIPRSAARRRGAGVPRRRRRAAPRLRWRDPRVLPWTIVGLVGGHGQAILLGVIGFLVIDRLSVPLDRCAALDRDRADGRGAGAPCSRNGG